MCVCGRPHAIVTPNSANKLFTQIKAPYTSSECKIRVVISKTLTFSGDSAFQGVLWGLVRILHPLWQGKGAFLNLPRSTSASGYKHNKCRITMLQCRIWDRGTENASASPWPQTYTRVAKRIIKDIKILRAWIDAVCKQNCLLAHFD